MSIHVCLLTRWLGLVPMALLMAGCTLAPPDRHCQREDMAELCTALATQEEVNVFVFPDPTAPQPDPQALESFIEAVTERAGHARVVDISLPTGRLLIRADSATLARLSHVEGARFAPDRFHPLAPPAVTPEETDVIRP